jgi:NADPH:quinone reductase-like Zn-dependent oxidoreductase
MKAAIVRAAGQPPVYGDFAEPEPLRGEQRIHVTAAALSNLVRGRAAGSHYSVAGGFPIGVGIDGVGRLDDGTRVYFLMPRMPFGSMAERTVVPAAHCLPVPDGLDDVTAAALANPGMSCWAAFTERARLRAGETVLINGATGTTGRLGVQVARHLGAARIIATGRNFDALRALATLGADETISLNDSDAALDERFGQLFAEGVDVVLDHLWGPVALRLLTAAARSTKNGRRVRFVQSGSMAGTEIVLPSALLRAAAIELMGTGLGSVPIDRLLHAIGAVYRATGPAGLRIATEPVPLTDFEQAWPRKDSSRRTVFTVGARP